MAVVYPFDDCALSEPGALMPIVSGCKTTAFLEDIVSRCNTKREKEEGRGRESEETHNETSTAPKHLLSVVCPFDDCALSEPGALVSGCKTTVC